ncbi:MAG: NAD(P)/FAD-dependent oxidoreductase [Lentisphaeraceae bacterium]|nr:NAD(P)/FAD-dependent oxidoreductase [Lentisphaeraceae bacterium]
MKVLVVGAGPAGSSVAYYLAKSGHEVTVVDPLGPHEKTCGGGVPIKGIFGFPEFYSDFSPAKKLYDSMTFSFDGQDMCQIPMPGGMGIFSREVHDKHIFDKALEAGVKYLPWKFKKCTEVNKVWRISTDHDDIEADYIIGADGATSRVRNRLSTKLPRESYFKATDYLVSRTDLPLHIGFNNDLNGYLWVFPRDENTSIGIVDFDDDTSRRMTALDEYLAKSDISEKDIISKRSALIPSLRKSDIRSHEISGKNWALVGDAAAMAEPITGEGIYYALRSARLLNKCLNEKLDYNSLWKKEFTQIVSESAVSRISYKIINLPLMKFFLRRSSLMRRMMGQYLAAFSNGKLHRLYFILCLPLVAVQSLFSKPTTCER